MIAATCAACATFAPGWAADAPQQPCAASSQSVEIQQMKAQMQKLQKQIDDLHATLDAEKKQLDDAEAAQTASQPDHKAPNLGDVASTTPIIPQGIAAAAAAAAPQGPAPTNAETFPESPLQIHLGMATITPVGFMDLTNTYRSTASGAGYATNFGSYPYNNGATGRLSEDRFSAGNSRLGLRVDALYHDIHVLGYYEGDFVGGVGNGANNTQVTSNSLLYRIRLYWIDLRKGKVEFLAGQSWSMLTPNRNGISALPGDLFYGQEFDVNYLNGLTWGRIPGLRFLYHPGRKVTMGVSLENSTQYFGGSGGGGVPVLPAALSSLASTELDSGAANGAGIPNVRPDIIAKIAFEPSSRVHFEIAGMTDQTKIWNPNTGLYFSKTGGGGSVNANFEVVKNFRLMTNNYWSDGGGRYLFGAVPNFIIRPDGSPSLMHAGSTVDGFEARLGKTQLYGYYGGIYAGRNVAIDTNGKPIGYGYAGSANSQNRTMQEGTIGITQTFFSNPRYGAVSMYLDYAYFLRNPWSFTPGQAGGKNAKQNAVWFDLRYTLPGSAPTIGY